MKSSELKLGHAYKLAGKEGPAFFINTHPHDGGTMIMAWNDAEEDEEKYLAVDSCEIEYEIPAGDTLMVFTDQYDAFLLAGRVLSSLPSILEHVRAIETRAADVQKTATSQGDSLWHAMETIDDRVHDLLTLVEDGEFRALTGADIREAQMVELRRKASAYDKLMETWQRPPIDVQPDSGRDAALVKKALTLADAALSTAWGYVKDSGGDDEEISKAGNAVKAALAAHPAPLVEGA